MHDPVHEPFPSLVFDFDSTLVTVEGADELFSRTLAGLPDQEARTSRFRELTDRGMSGEITYAESLRLRLGLLEASREQVHGLGRDLRGHITPSVARCRDFLQEHADRIAVVSGGFEELILPVVEVLGLNPHRVRAHRFRWNERGRIDGVDPDTALARGGKAAAVRELALPRPVWVVGDGATDLELREAGLADRFLAFVENRDRPGIAERADEVLRSLEPLVRSLRDNLGGSGNTGPDTRPDSGTRPDSSARPDSSTPPEPSNRPERP